MKHIKKFDKKEKKEKVEDQQMNFDAETLVDKDGLPGFKSEVEDNEKVQKEFKKNMGKIEKFESFVQIHIDNIDTMNINTDFEFEGGDEDDEDEFDAEYEEDSGCGCCQECTGQPGCQCGCEDCVCDEEEIEKASDVISTMSENLRYHLKNNKPITESVFRPGSDAFFNVIKEARQLFDLGKIELCGIDKSIYEETEIGKFGNFKGKKVALDIPMENVEEINEAEYKGKEVKLNYPMRGGTKKYYVYVKNPKTGKVKKIAFGDVHGGLTAKVSNPEARRNFAARHKCSTKKDKTKAGYWACRINRYGHLFGGKTYPGYW